MDSEKQIAAILAAVERGLRDIRLSEQGLPKRVRFTLFYDGGTAEHEIEVKENEQ